MKNKLIFLIIGMFLISFISAEETLQFDNVKSYDKDLQKVTIEDTFGLGRTIADIKLNTPIHYYVPRGYQKVAEFTINSYDDTYTDALKQIEFYKTSDLKSNIDRKVDYKVLTYEDYQSPIYKEVCKESFKNGSLICKSELVGYETKQKEVWKDFDSKMILKGNYTIGIFTEVLKGDKIEWIPTFYGVKIDEWAIWEESLNVDLTHWYKLGLNFSDSEKTLNGTNSGTTNITGKYILYGDGLGKYFDGSSTFIQYGNESLTNALTWSFWIYTNRTSASGDGDVIYIKTINNTNLEWISIVGTEIKYWQGCGSACQNKYTTNGAGLTANTWYHIVLTGSGQGIGAYEIWINGVNQTVDYTVLGGGNRPTGTTTDITMGAGLGKYTQGIIDEFAIWDRGKMNSSEILTLYNDDNGCTYGLCNLTSPPSVTLNSPTNNSIVTNKTFIVNLSMSGTNYSYQWKNITYNVWTHNGTLVSSTFVSDLSGNQTYLTQELTGFTYANNYTWNVEAWYGNLTFSNYSLGSNGNYTFNYTSIYDMNNYTYDLNVTESSSTTISGQFQTENSITSAYLQYNNTNYSTSLSSLGSGIYILSNTVTSPSVVADVNISWNFWINGVNTTLKNQTVLNINLDNCSSYIYPIITYYLLDEPAQTLINNSNSSIETTIILRTISGLKVEEINKKIIGNSTPTICSESNLSSTGLRLWEQSRYGADNYVYEQHNLQNASMTTLPVNISLLDLPSTDATTFRITYKSATFLPVADAVLDIQRKYLGEGVFKSVESPITDANGEASASFDLNAVIYRIEVKINGTVLGAFENPAIACDNILSGECNIDLNERQIINLINNYDIENDIEYGLTQDNRTITLTFSIPSGTAKTVNLFVNQSNILGNKTSCNQTLYATSGQLVCTVEESLGDVYTSIIVSVNGEVLTYGSAQVIEDRSEYFGTDNIVLTFFLVLSLILLLISDPVMVLIGIVIGLISSSLMLFLNSGTVFGKVSVLTYLVITIILVIVKISTRRDRNIGV